ncbi:MAG: hypothetical protein ABW174_01080 [Flavitalea sp.]
MKAATEIIYVALLAIALLTACAKPSYFGKTYPATENVDVYFDASDVKKPYTTMGTMEIDQDLRSIEATQRKVIEIGKAKGADAVITRLEEETAVIQQSGGGIVNKKSKVNTYSSSATTTNIKKKKIIASFIKYS